MCAVSCSFVCFLFVCWKQFVQFLFCGSCGFVHGIRVVSCGFVWFRACGFVWFRASNFICAFSTWISGTCMALSEARMCRGVSRGVSSDVAGATVRSGDVHRYCHAGSVNRFVLMD